MKFKIVATLFIVFGFIISNAQTGSNPGNNSLSFELGKSGLIYNFNFDHRLKDKRLGIRLGIGSNFSKYLQAFMAGGGGYYLRGHRLSFLELGIDLSYLSVNETSDDQKSFPLIYPNYPVKTYYVSANIGYRKYGKKTLFRIGGSPGIIKNHFLPGGYISYGFTF